MGTFSQNCTEWLQNVLLLLDGHTTYSNNLEALEFCRENHIHLLQLLAHTTYRLQLVDVAFFKPLQSYYVQAEDSWWRAHVGQAISAYDIAELVNAGYGKAATIGTAENTFKAPGI
ncbi:dde superfamily endonuclease [Holotrichia oblita]|uniref:Dde superfamily endonuclease n=1 Tax=Holotrichia oblita TaxID=644536 RepID=A0ACB9TQM4_HOLOL|nr:dde superfamily endonuclease [Holotrichia oblita]